MSETFEPELGQLCFGNAHGSIRCPEYITALLERLADEVSRVMTNNSEDDDYFDPPTQNVGREFRNDVFEMRSYYWGGCKCGFEDAEARWEEENAHAETCYQADLRKLTGPPEKLHSPSREEYRALCERHGVPWNDGFGCMVHCTCGRDQRYVAWRRENGHDPECGVVRPNFRCGDFEVRWHKHARRSATINRKIQPSEAVDIFDRCFKSVEAMERDWRE